MDYLRSIKPKMNLFILIIIETCCSPNEDENVSKIIDNDNFII